MNWLIKFSKNIIIFTFSFLVLNICSYSEVITGSIRQEYDVNKKEEINKTIEDVKPVYSTGAILAYNNGIGYFNNMDYDKAIESFNLAIKQEERFGDAYFNLGLLYYSFDNQNMALISFNKAYLSNKKDYEALFYMVKCYIDKNDKIAAKYYARKIPKSSKFYKKVQELIK